MKKKRRKNEVLSIGTLFSALTLLILVLLISLLSPNFSPTGRVVEQTTSQVSIQKYLAIAKSTELNSGIDFGSISNLPVSNLNATENYNQTSQTQYSLLISQDSNTNVDFCIKANDHLRKDATTFIDLSNYYWNDNSLNTLSNPSLTNNELSLSYLLGNTNLTPGSRNYYRFWVDLAPSLEPGTYNNTIMFQAVPAGDPCI